MGKVQVQAGRHYIDNEDHIWQDAAAVPDAACFRLQSGRGMAKTTATFTPAGRCVEFPAVLLVEEITITLPRLGEPRNPHHLGRSLSGHCEACGADVGERCRADCPDRAQPIDNATLAAATAEADKQRQETGRTMGDPVALTGERKKTHGDWIEQSQVTNNLKGCLRTGSAWAAMPAYQKEALDMLATKMGRIVAGNPDHADHWDDIAGYAHLGKGGHTTE